MHRPRRYIRPLILKQALECGLQLCRFSKAYSNARGNAPMYLLAPGYDSAVLTQQRTRGRATTFSSTASSTPQIFLHLEIHLSQLYGIVKKNGTNVRSTRQNPRLQGTAPAGTSTLYQISLCVMTFSLVMTIQRTMERICVRVDELDLWIADVYLCRFLDVCLRADNCTRMILTGGTGRNAHFMAYPSTTTVIAAIILFLNSIIWLNYHNRNDAMLHLSIVNMVIAIIKSIKWTRFFASLQERAPNIIWSNSVLSALSHPIFRWDFPDLNAMLVRSVHSMSEGFKRDRPNQRSREKLQSLESG